MLFAVRSRVSFALLILIWCPYPGIGLVQTPVEERAHRIFPLVVGFGFAVLYSP